MRVTDNYVGALARSIGQAQYFFARARQFGLAPAIRGLRLELPPSVVHGGLPPMVLGRAAASSQNSVNERDDLGIFDATAGALPGLEVSVVVYRLPGSPADRLTHRLPGLPASRLPFPLP